MNRMISWDISDAEIEAIERMLLPADCHFADDAKSVIRHWDSAEISACPGSGKTTVLLAKLKLIADRMPLEGNAGICVLSHTNVAINEIKSKLENEANKIINYPNYVGTIQSFIDHYIVLPYLKEITVAPVQIVDNRIYAQHLHYFLSKNKTQYGSLIYFIKAKYKQSNADYENIVDYMAGLSVKNDSLYHNRQSKAVAGAGSNSAKQYVNAKAELLKAEGMLTYQDAYHYATQAVCKRNDLSNLLSMRFGFVFIDEYQDCSKMQRDVLSHIFDKAKCKVFRIGDPDQAIYNSEKDNPEDWRPMKTSLQIVSTNRYGQEIADILHPLRIGKQQIESLRGQVGIPPTIIVYNDETISNVLPSFIKLLDDHKLTDSEGIYKVIGWIKSESTKGRRIGDYWNDFSADDKGLSETKYWAFIESICNELEKGKLYQAEKVIRKLLCRILHYLECKDFDGNSFTFSSILQVLDNKYFEIYRNAIKSLTYLPIFSKAEVDHAIRILTNELLKEDKSIDIFPLLPAHLMEDTPERAKKKSNTNIFIDSILGRKIQFNTVHKVKGETHDATLYLETETKGSSDIKRIIAYYNGKKPNGTPIVDYSRKCVYVGFSRPRKLLCVAMHESTYNSSGSAFSSWEVYDCRKPKND